MALPLSTAETTELRIVKADDAVFASASPRVSKALGTLESRVQLMTALQASLSVDAILQAFFRHAQTRLRVCGMWYRHNEAAEQLTFGTEGTHSLAYRLITRELHLGELIVSRQRVFSANNMAEFEDMLMSLLHPLNNALRYAAALKAARTDSLTQIGNRAALHESLDFAINSAKRYQHSLSVLLVDLDSFKQINDGHGHETGDRVLQEVVAAIIDATRNTDQCFRLGGDEFVVLLGNTPAAGASIIAERVCQAIASLNICSDSGSIVTSASVGAATWQTDESQAELLERADMAMYQAKAHGGNTSLSQNNKNATPHPISL